FRTLAACAAVTASSWNPCCVAVDASSSGEIPSSSRPICVLIVTSQMLAGEKSTSFSGDSNASRNDGGKRSGAPAAHSRTSVSIRSLIDLPFERRDHLFGKRSVELLRDGQSAHEPSELSPRRGRCHRDKARDRLSSFGDDDLGALADLFEKPRQVGLCFVDVHSAHRSDPRRTELSLVRLRSTDKRVACGPRETHLELRAAARLNALDHE